MSRRALSNGTINPRENKFPYCVVFAYLPCVSTFLPIIGHVGICTSEGLVHDFVGSYCISVDSMAFSDPLKYWVLDKSHMSLSITDEAYDEAIEKADKVFKGRKHNLFLNNCHHHVAMALNNIKYKGRTDWTPFKVFFNLVIHGKFVSWKYFLVLYGPFLMIIVMLCVITGLFLS